MLPSPRSPWWSVASATRPPPRGPRSGSPRRARRIARELANTPPSHLTARGLASKARELAAESGLAIEVFDKDQLAVLGAGAARGRCRFDRTTPHDQAQLCTTQPESSCGARGQGRDVRLGRDQPQAHQPDARPDEDGHVGCRRSPGDDVIAQGVRVPQPGHRLADVHRQHAVGVGDEVGRRVDDPQRQDGGDPQHRCRRSADPGRRVVAWRPRPSPM